MFQRSFNFLVCLCVLFVGLEATQKYTVQEVPLFYDYYMTLATSIGGHTLKSDGSILGEGIGIDDDEMYYDTFCWNNSSGVFSLNAKLKSTGLDSVHVYDRNQRGQILGTLMNQENNRVPFLWCPIQGLHLIEMADAYPFKINNSGQVVLTTGSHYFLWEKDCGVIPVTWPDHVGISNPKAISFNDMGHILFIDEFSVFDHDTDSSKTAFIWENGTDPKWIKINGKNNSANCINNNGDAVGISGSFSLKRGTLKGFIQLNDGQTITVGSKKNLIWFHSINDHRQVVGQCIDKKNYAIIWDAEEGLRNLNDLIVGSRPKYMLTEAISINNQGEILALSSGEYGLSANLFLLTPE